MAMISDEQRWCGDSQVRVRALRVPRCLQVTHRCPALVGPAVMAAVLQVQVQLQVVLGPRFDPAVGATLTQCTVAAPRVSAPPGHPSCTTNGIVCTYMIRYRIARQIYTQNQIAYTKAKTPLICIQRAPVNAPTNLHATTQKPSATDLPLSSHSTSSPQAKSAWRGRRARQTHRQTHPARCSPSTAPSRRTQTSSRWLNQAPRCRSRTCGRQATDT